MSERTMARTVSCAGSWAFIGNPPRVFVDSPAAVAALVPFPEPLHERLEVLDDRGRVHLARAREFLERILPGLAASHREHVLVRAARLPAAEDRALVELALESRLLAERALELELQHERQEIARVWRVAGHVVLRGRVEVRFAARHRRVDALVLAAQVPPGLVVLLRRNRAREDAPAPLVDELAERQERDLLARDLHLPVDQRLAARLRARRQEA